MDPTRAVARPAAALSAPLLGTLAVSGGLAVASLYYMHPVLALLGESFHTSAASLSLIPMLTQLGYATGNLLLNPLGDRFDRRRVIVSKALLLVLALLASAFAASLPMLLAASFAVGTFASLGQDIVPAVATLAPAAHRGRAVALVTTGLLLGILLSRVVSGSIAAQWGWRTVFLLAAAAMAVVAAVLHWRLPHFERHSTLPYPALIGSLFSLWRRHALLRRVAFAQALLSLGFSAFWSTLAVWLHQAPFHLGSAGAGAFGLAGAAGALAASMAGRLADRHGPGNVSRLGATMVLLAFATLLTLPAFGRTSGLVLVAVTIVVFDMGMQAAVVAHQSLVFGLEPDARSRMNAIFVTLGFLGMSSGSALGGLALEQFGVRGVFGLATIAAAWALLLRRRDGAPAPAATATP